MFYIKKGKQIKMKKIEQLRSANLKSINEIQKYVEKCRTFIKSFIDNFVKYLECDRIDIIYDYESFSFDKSFFYFSFKLKLYNEEKSHRKERLIFQFEINTANDEWEIRLNEEIERLAKKHKIDPDTFKGGNDFFEFIFNATLDYYENRLNYLSENSFDDKKVGFLPDEKK